MNHFQNTFLYIYKYKHGLERQAVALENMAVSMGNDFLVAVNSNGVVFTCGNNKKGQLGVCPELDEIPQRTLLEALDLHSTADQENVFMVSAGYAHAACVTRNGSVYTWGCGENGQLGIARIQPYSRPQRVYSVLHERSPATMIACGDNYTLMLTAAGHVWGCGDNLCFQLGIENTTNPLRTPYCNVAEFTIIPPARFDCGDGHTGVSFIAAAQFHSVAVGRDNGMLWTWGQCSVGRLGHGDGHSNSVAKLPTAIQESTFDEPIVSAFVTRTFTMAVTATGVLWASGKSEHGALGLGEIKECHRFKRVGGPEYFRDQLRSVACSSHHSVIVTRNGSIWVCGDKNSHCLGFDADEQDYSRPLRMHYASFDRKALELVSAYGTRSVAVTTDGGLYTWGCEPAAVRTGLCLAAEDRTVYYSPDTKMDVIVQYEPKKVLYTGLWHENIDPFGLWIYPVSEEEKLAFAMCTHMRLGPGSPYSHMPREILELVLDNSRKVPGVKLMGTGLRNVLGI